VTYFFIRKLQRKRFYNIGPCFQYNKTFFRFTDEESTEAITYGLDKPFWPSLMFVSMAMWSTFPVGYAPGLPGLERLVRYRCSSSSGPNVIKLFTAVIYEFS
jgi:hypothetical protein